MVMKSIADRLHQINVTLIMIEFQDLLINYTYQIFSFSRSNIKTFMVDHRPLHSLLNYFNKFKWTNPPFLFNRSMTKNTHAFKTYEKYSRMYLPALQFACILAYYICYMYTVAMSDDDTCVRHFSSTYMYVSMLTYAGPWKNKITYLKRIM